MCVCVGGCQDLREEKGDGSRCFATFKSPEAVKKLVARGSILVNSLDVKVVNKSVYLNFHVT